jgi:hypothetical protein
VIAPLALGMMFALGSASIASAQDHESAAQAPAAAPAAGTFNGPVGILLVQIKPDQTAAYEGLLTKLKEALSKAEKPERKEMAKGWKVYKYTPDPKAPAPVAIYVHIVDPVVTGQDYLEAYKLISEVFPSEVQDVYAKTKDAFAQNPFNVLSLAPFMTMTP